MATMSPPTAGCLAQEGGVAAPKRDKCHRGLRRKGCGRLPSAPHPAGMRPGGGAGTASWQRRSCSTCWASYEGLGGDGDRCRHHPGPARAARSGEQALGPGLEYEKGRHLWVSPFSVALAPVEPAPLRGGAMVKCRPARLSTPVTITSPTTRGDVAGERISKVADLRL